ncbi:MAG: hypothetical protein A4E66_00228 [Syntrophus sp. PtaB.Bin001]|nr:MAG: hypothetical protein A4E66_00228 [Syntrophus sp. PtaB.Bin001]
MDEEIHDFTKAIGATTPQLGSENYATFKAIFKRSNYFLLGNKFIMVKISRSEKPFWGIGKGFIDLLNNTDYLLVLLVSNREGWAFSKDEVNSNIRNKKWNLRAADNNYKINWPLPDRNSFSNPEVFLRKFINN